jgi:hypothetical protein
MNMEREIHHIDEYFTENLGNIEFNPPEEVWNNIAKELDRKRRIRSIAIWSGMAASIAILISVGLYIGNTRKNPLVVEIYQSNSQKGQTSNAVINRNNTNLLISRSTKIKSNFDENLNSEKSLVNANHEEHDAIVKSQDSVITDNNTVVQNLNTEPLKEKINYISARTSKLENSLPVISFTDHYKVNDLAYIYPVQESKIDDNLEKEKNRPKRWSVEGQVAPQYSYRNISEISGNLPNKSVYNKSENGLAACGGGVKVNYATGRRLSIQAGVYYSEMGQIMNKVYAVTEKKSGMSAYATNKKSAYWVNNSLGIIETKDSNLPNTQNQSVTSQDVSYSAMYFNRTNTSDVLKAVDESYGNGSLVENAQIIQRLRFIEIPFLARYQVINGKISCNLIGGLSTSVLINNNVLLKQNGSKSVIGETAGLQRFNYSGTIGLGINYQWFRNVSLNIEPTYKYYLNSISSNENMKVHLYSIGIFTGLVYKF